MASGPPDKEGLGMLWWAARNPPADPTTSFQGKTVLITGANVGLGFESAVKFAALGATRLIFGVRSLQRGEEARAAVCARTSYEPKQIHIYQLDMSTFESVCNFAHTVAREESRVDVALLNAGVAAAAYNLSPEGYEMSLQVNVLSTALLAILLLPSLRRTSALSGAPTHLELLGSASHQDAKAEQLKLGADESVLAKVNSKSFFNVQVQYGVSKLLLMYVMEGLAAAANPQAVIVTTVCPGLCRSNLGRDFPAVLKVVVGLFQRVYARSSEEGARSVVSGVTLGPDAHGEFWSHDVFFRKGDLVKNTEGKALQSKAWAEILQILRSHVADLESYLLE